MTARLIKPRLIELDVLGLYPFGLMIPEPPIRRGDAVASTSRSPSGKRQIRVREGTAPRRICKPRLVGSDKVFTLSSFRNFRFVIREEFDAQTRFRVRRMVTCSRGGLSSARKFPTLRQIAGCTNRADAFRSGGDV